MSRSLLIFNEEPLGQKSGAAKWEKWVMLHVRCAAWGENMYLSALTGGGGFFFFLIHDMTGFMISFFFCFNASFGSNPNVLSTIIAYVK